MIALLLLLAGCAHSPTLHQVPEGRSVSLPADHAPHDWAQTEWWHVHADLEDVETGEPLHLFAGFVVERTELDRAAFLPISPLVDPYHVAYVQLVAHGDARFASRSNVPLAFDTGFAGDGLDLHHEGWRIAVEGETVVLVGSVRGHKLRLRLRPTRATTIPGEAGAIEIVPGTRHLWYQQEGMEADGLWVDDGRRRWVRGTGFFKHQWGRLYDPDVDGFEWLSFDLPDGRSFVLVQVQQHGRRGVPGSLAWVTHGGGRPTALPIDQIRFTTLETTKSDRSGARWPTEWRVQGAGLDLRVTSVVDDMELTVFPAAFYAGPARVEGTVDGEAVDAPGFVELVGAWQPALRPLFRSDPPPKLSDSGQERSP